MGATHSRKKKVSSKNVKKENCERREEVQSKGSASHRRVEEERNGAGDSNFRNSNFRYVYNHNFLDYKLKSVRKKYSSNNGNPTGKDTKQNYPEHFNPFAEDEQYSSSLNPFDDQGNYPSDRNPFEDTDSSNSSSETGSKECFNPDEETDDKGDEIGDSGDVIENSGDFESPEVNSTPERSLKAREDDENCSEIKVPDKNEDVKKDTYNVEYKIEDNGGIESPKAYPTPENSLIMIEDDTSSSKVKVEEVLNDLYDTECEVEDSESFANPERNSKPQRTTIATQAENNNSEVKVVGYSEDTLRDLDVSENKDGKIDRSENGSVLAIEMENKSRMNDILKEDSSKKFSKKDMFNNKASINDIVSCSEINQNESTNHFLMMPSSDKNRSLFPVKSASSLEKTGSVEKFKEVMSCKTDIKTENREILFENDPKIKVIEFDKNAKIKLSNDFYNKSNETVNINQNTTPKNYSSSENMTTSIVPAAKRKSYKKYKAPAPPVLTTSIPKIESYLLKEKENISMSIINKNATYNNSSLTSSSKVDKCTSPPNTASKTEQQKQSYNNKNSSNPPANVGLQQGEPKNTYRIARPAPPPPLAESGKSNQVINDDDTSLTKKIIPVNQLERKTRRKSIWDLFKVKKKKKESIDMF